MRSIALDVHRDFCEVAIKDDSGLRLAGRTKSSPEELQLFAQSLAPDDQVALEATGPALQIARMEQVRSLRSDLPDLQSACLAAPVEVKELVAAPFPLGGALWRGARSRLGAAGRSAGDAGRDPPAERAVQPGEARFVQRSSAQARD